MRNCPAGGGGVCFKSDKGGKEIYIYINIGRGGYSADIPMCLYQKKKKTDGAGVFIIAATAAATAAIDKSPFAFGSP